LIRALVVDDEEPARRNLISMLDDAVEVVGEAVNGVEALEKVFELAPDVIFLDVEMPQMNGFEMLAQLSNPPHVVFVTAYDHHAIQAFEAHAVDYILKPLRRERVAKAVERLRAGLGSSPSVSLRNVLQQFPVAMKIAGRRGKKICLLSPCEVVWIGIEDRLVFLHTAQDRFLVDRTIVELENILSPQGFFRVSRGEIVNLQHAREVIPGSSGTWQLILSNGRELDVSRERSRELRAAMGF
jgi:DNA-binding LytR/AlgR family response regulator